MTKQWCDYNDKNDDYDDDGDKDHVVFNDDDNHVIDDYSDVDIYKDNYFT